MQSLPSLQLEGHELGGSQVSPVSTTLLPQLAEQSVSVLESQPVGQQPSPGVQAVMVLWLQLALQFVALPVSESVVQALPSLQVVGHVSGGSQVSLVSTTPLPQVAEQSVSVAELQLGGQQPSPGVQVSMVPWVQETLQVSALPVI